MLRPTGRGLVVVVAATLSWLLADLTRVMPARYLAAGLLLALLVGLACILLGRIGLRAQREVLDDAVPIGSPARIQLDLSRGALFPWLPLGRGAVREHLPAALGGTGDLSLSRSMPHLLRVAGRGTHELGPYSLVLRDIFGLFHLRRTVADGARITGMPLVGELTPQATSATGITRDGTRSASHHGVGEIGPIARPYAAGDDVRRIHWRASARAGELMTREEEPSAGQTAVVVLDTTRRQPAPDAEDALVSHAATVLESLGRNGWEVRVLDASGDEITRTTPHRGIQGGSPLGREADAVESRAALLSLAEVGFDDDPAASRHRTDHAAGHTALAIALGIDDGAPFEGLELDRFAGRATHRTAITLRPTHAGTDADDGAGGTGRAAATEGEAADGGAKADGRSADGARTAGGKGIGRRWTRRIGPGDGEDFGAPMRRQTAEEPAGDGGTIGENPFPTRTRLGAWTLVHGTPADSLAELLIAADSAPVGAPGGGATAAPADPAPAGSAPAGSASAGGES